MKNQIEKKLNETLLPQIERLLISRDEAKETLRRAQQLIANYQAEKKHLEHEISHLKSEQRAAMVQGADVAAFASEIRTKTDRLQAIVDFLPENPAANPTANERQAFERIQRDLGSATQMALSNFIKQQLQPDIDRIVKALEATLTAYDEAILGFKQEHSINAPYHAQLTVFTTIDLERRILPERHRN